MKENKEDELDYFLFLQAELAYQHAHEDMDEEDLYPFSWYSASGYKFRTEIIAEALEKGVLVQDTELYRKASQEGKFGAI